MQNSGGPMAQGNTRGSLDPDGTRPALFHLMNKEHSRGGQSLEGLTKFPNPVGNRRGVLIQSPSAQTLTFRNGNEMYRYRKKQFEGLGHFT